MRLRRRCGLKRKQRACAERPHFGEGFEKAKVSKGSFSAAGLQPGDRPQYAAEALRPPALPTSTRLAGTLACRPVKATMNLKKKKPARGGLRYIVGGADAGRAGGDHFIV